MKKEKVLPLVAAIVLLITGFMAILVPQNFMMDDSFFYMQIANNIAQGHGSTFNQIHETNGYHPLWMLICSALAFISNGDKQLLLNLAAVSQVLLTFVIVYLGIKISTHLRMKAYLYFLPLLIMFFIAFTIIGSEGTVNGLFFLLTIYLLILYKDSAKLFDSFKIGLSMGLLFLARLDNSLVIIVLVALSGIFALQKEGIAIVLKRMIVISTGIVLIAFPYLFYNYANFGHLVPISGALKSTFPTFSMKLNSLGKTGLGYTSFSLLLILWALFFEKNKQWKQVGVLIGVASITTNIYVFLFTNSVTCWNWYWVLNVISLTFLASFVFESIFSKRKYTKYSTIAGVAVFSLVSIYSLLFNYVQFNNPVTMGYNPLQKKDIGGKRWQIDISEKFSDYVPEKAIIATIDWPGALAYYSNNRIFAIDGLISNFGVQDSIKRLGMMAYLKTINAEYFFGPNFSLDKPYMGFSSQLINKDSMKFQFYAVKERVPIDLTYFAQSAVIFKTDEIIPLKLQGNNKYFDSWTLWKIDN